MQMGRKTQLVMILTAVVGLIVIAGVVVGSGIFTDPNERPATISVMMVEQPPENATVYSETDQPVVESEVLQELIYNVDKEEETYELSDKEIEEVENVLEKLDHHSGTGVEERGYYFERNGDTIRITGYELL